MVKVWGAFALFQELLDGFGVLLSKVAESSSANEVFDDPMELRIAQLGFSLFSPADHWGQEQSRFIRERLDGELSLESLSWYEADAPAIRAFTCLALGTMLGKFAAGQINDAEFLLGDAHLAGFIALHNEAIGIEYNKVM